MRISVLWIVLLLLCAAPAGGQTAGLPMMNSVDPASGKPGDLVTARGSRLGPEDVVAVFLTDGNVDIRVEIVEQTAAAIKFRIPRTAKPGRMALMVLTGGREGRYIEEPVKINIQADTTAH